MADSRLDIVLNRLIRSTGKYCDTSVSIQTCQDSLVVSLADGVSGGVPRGRILIMTGRKHG